MKRLLIVVLMAFLLFLSSCYGMTPKDILELSPGNNVPGTREDMYKGLVDNKIVFSRWRGAWEYTDVLFVYTEGMSFSYRGCIYKNVVVLPNGIMTWDNDEAKSN